jgi:nucleoside-diphosphate-sugar epimerase
MPSSLVFGASGAIGRFLVPRLLGAGHEVVAVSRELRESRHPRLRWITGDLPSRVPELPQPAAIFSLGPLDAFAAWFAENAAGYAARIVAIGSLSAETKRVSYDPNERELAERLALAEQALASTADSRGCASTVLRATLIYGAGLDKSLTPIVHFARRWRMFPYVVDARGLRQPVHADDLAAACVMLATLPAMPQRVYAVGGGERLAFATMLARVRESLPFATIPMPLPFAFARAGAGIARRLPAYRAASATALARMNEDLIADHAAAIADFGWAPRAFRPDSSTWTPPPLP